MGMTPLAQIIDLSGVAEKAVVDAIRAKTDALPAAPASQTKLDRVDAVVPLPSVRDEFYWPCIDTTDERQVAPALKGSVYAAVGGLPVVEIRPSATASNHVRYPRIPRRNVHNKTTLVLGAWISAEEPVMFDYGVPVDPPPADLGALGVRAQFVGGFWELKSHDGVAQERTITNVGTAQWRRIELRLEPAAVALVIDDVERARHVTRFWEPAVGPTGADALKMQIGRLAGGTIPIFVAHVRARWE